MAEVNMYIAETDVKIDTGEALGFFGPDGFDDPLSLGEFNGRTFSTTPSGITPFEECDNCRRISSSGVVIGQTGTGINITYEQVSSNLPAPYNHGDPYGTSGGGIC